MSSVSPYSSTNSLNSSDSSGNVNHQRISNSHAITAPGRRKRIAPRPPSQNSIPEDPEKSVTVLKRSNLVRQNFHVSSPNLTINGNMAQKSFSSYNIDIESVVNSNTDAKRNENSSNNEIKTPDCDSLQNNNMENDNIKMDNQLFASHSRTSSETSDIGNKETNTTDAQPRKRTTQGEFFL